MTCRILMIVMSLFVACSLTACGTARQQSAKPHDVSENSGYENVEGTQIKMITEKFRGGYYIKWLKIAVDLAAMGRTIDGLRGYLECLPGAKEMRVIYGAGVWQLDDIQRNPALQEAYQMGINIC